MSEDILSIGVPASHISDKKLMKMSINGHDQENLGQAIKFIFEPRPNANKSCFIDLRTIKGKGVSFMEAEHKWHHRRFRDGEYERAKSELKGR